MSAKTSEKRKEAFFRALSETGNQTVSAERARVSRSWVSLHRASDPAFRARMEACIAEARARIRAASAISPDRKWAYLDGEELVIRGTNGVRAQIARARLKQWTGATERVFLRTLAATANVTAACKEAGLSVPSAYIHRSKYESFADRWDEASDIGETRLAFALVNGAINSLRPAEIEPDAPMPAMTFDQMFILLRAHKNNRRKAPRTAMPKDLDELRGSIMKKVLAIRRHGEMEKRQAADRSGEHPHPRGAN